MPDRQEPASRFLTKLKSGRDIRLFHLAAVLAVATALYLVFTVYGLLNILATEANKLDDTKARLAVQSSFENLKTQLASMLEDNAKWDDAYNNVKPGGDAAWYYDTWGYVTEGGAYDIAILFSADQSVLYAATGGQEIADPAPVLSALDVGGLIGKTRISVTEYETATSFAMVDGRLMVVAAGPIAPNDLATLDATRPQNYLIFARAITPALTAEIGRQQIITGLSITPGPPVAAHAVAIKDLAGRPIASASWQADLPGDKAKAKAAFPAAMALAATLFCLLLSMFMIFRFLRTSQANEAHALRLANVDSLTGLNNRLWLNEHLSGLLERHEDGAPNVFSVVLADLDGFKNVNDTYGHKTGDQVLMAAAERFGALAASMNGIVCRLGGDEFAVLLTGRDAIARAVTFCDRARASMVEPVVVEGCNAYLGVSLGIASHDGSEPMTAVDLLRRADVAMYAAKKGGKNRFSFYTGAMDAAWRRQKLLSEKLANDILAQKLEVFYQPYVDARTKVLVGVEALARWRTDDGAAIAPDEFIMIAEEFGLIGYLGQFVLRRACLDLLDASDLRLSVNLSGFQLKNPSLAKDIAAILAETGFPHHRLELEITESSVIDQPDVAKRILAEFRAMGVGLALDDFGAGYSSIGYVRQFSFDKLKIDRSLVTGLVDDPVNAQIVQSIITLASTMGMTVTAEGVEDAEVGELLARAGCDQLQGFHFGRPMGVATLRDFAVSMRAKSRVVGRAG